MISKSPILHVHFLRFFISNENNGPYFLSHVVSKIFASDPPREFNPPTWKTNRKQPNNSNRIKEGVIMKTLFIQWTPIAQEDI